MAQSTAGEWILSASDDLSAAELETALRDASADEMFLVPCDEEQAEEAVVRMKAMTSRPVWMDGEDADLYEDGLIEALGGPHTPAVGWAAGAFLPEWAEIGLGIPAILATYCWVIWTWGFGPEDRLLLRRDKGNAANTEGAA